MTSEDQPTSHNSNSVNSTTSMTIDEVQVYEYDPLAVLFREKLHMNRFLTFIILFLITFGCFYALYVLPGVKARLVNQATFALLETTTACLFYAAYIWLPNAVTFPFHALKENGVVDNSLQEYEKNYKSFLSRIEKWPAPILSLLFTLLYLLYRYSTDGPPFLGHVPILLQFFTAFIDGLIGYCAFMSIIHLSISMLFVNRLFSHDIHVKPLHPDGCGGLGVMHRILWITVAIILATTLTFFETIEISVANNIPSSPLDAVMLTAAYLILTPSLLAGWLVLPHYWMLKARQVALLPLANEFQHLVNNSQLVMQKDTSQILADTDRLSAIKRHYDMLSGIFPTWPVEIGQLCNMIAALSLPVLIPLFPYIANMFKFIGTLLPK